MDSWKDAWVIFIKDLRTDRLVLIWNVIFMLYVSLMLGSMVGTRQEVGYLQSPISDFLMLTMIPSTGFFFSRRSFNYIKEDAYTRMLRYYRVLPIPLKTVMRSRLIQLGAAMLFNAIIFYITFYWSASPQITFAPGEFIAFALTWTGYALLINGVFIYFELLKKGKAYLWMTVLFMAALGLLAIAADWLGGNLLLYTMDVSRRYGLLSPLTWGSLAVGALGLILLSVVTQRKLQTRDLG